MSELLKDGHTCGGHLPDGAYGAAIESCCELDDNTLWVGNGEYASQVNYCPYCGYKAITEATVKPII